MRRSGPTVEELPPTSDELSVVAFVRALGLSPEDAIARLSVAVEWDDERGGWTRKPQPRMLPKGWKIVG